MNIHWLLLECFEDGFGGAVSGVEVGKGVWVVGGVVGFAFAAEVGVAADTGSTALAFPVDDSAFLALL